MAMQKDIYIQMGLLTIIIIQRMLLETFLKIGKTKLFCCTRLDKIFQSIYGKEIEQLTCYLFEYMCVCICV